MDKESQCSGCVEDMHWSGRLGRFLSLIDEQNSGCVTEETSQDRCLGEGFCPILFVAAPHQVELHHTFYTVQPIAKFPTGSPKTMPTWLYRQHFAMFPLNRQYNVRKGVACEYCNFNIK
ncbi:hypothetical protein TNCV_2069091 [Trichonephila clavipes]|uniref:Uncharacterized protein n=1 Tax=Trichonephila clavipes TaxID=2585209 RepID=A0A8X7BE45_TRICX|nr:hypothetical protein TNCV_2069091 [Trichonephila clavipes]